MSCKGCHNYATAKAAYMSHLQQEIQGWKVNLGFQSNTHLIKGPVKNEKAKKRRASERKAIFSADRAVTCPV